MTIAALHWLDGAAADRTAAGLRRSPTSRPAGTRDVLDLAGNDYLGLARHPEVVEACRLSRARVVVVPHDDLEAIQVALEYRFEERAMLVTDAVFSVSGLLAPLAALHRLARAAGAVPLVDEAHSVGVVGPDGRGAVEAAGAGHVVRAALGVLA